MHGSGSMELPMITAVTRTGEVDGLMMLRTKKGLKSTSTDRQAMVGKMFLKQTIKGAISLNLIIV